MSRLVCLFVNQLVVPTLRLLDKTARFDTRPREKIFFLGWYEWEPEDLVIVVVWEGAFISVNALDAMEGGFRFS